MEWDMLLGLTGLYIVLLVTLIHQWIMNKRIIDLASATQQTLEQRRDIITKTLEERMMAAEK
ncbi:hypothetical protein BMS3Abin16_01402 [archaeon BMS3Abin16]|nr:hypothetical protein BMS3Abin16_01402 [archaeon BMS3Abin16]